MSLSGSWVQTTVGSVVLDIQPGFAQKPGEEDEGTTPQIRTHNITPEGKISLEGIKHITPSDKETARYSLSIGDVIFNNTNSEEWVGKSAVFDQEGEFVFSNHMTRLRVNPELISPEYLASNLHFLWSMGYSKTRAKRWVSQAGIESNTLASFKIPLPVIAEQQRIVDILHHSNQVAELRKKYDLLLNKTKRALFVELFGDPNPKYNDKWPTVRLGKLVEIGTGGTPSRQQSDNYGPAHTWVKSTDLKDSSIKDTEEKISELGIQRSNAKLYPPGTVLLAMYGQGQTRGRTGKLLIEASCNQACAALLPNEKLLADYLWMWLQLSYDAVRSLGRGGQQENLNLSIIRGIEIPKPPVPLQQEFSRRLAALSELEEASHNAKQKYTQLLKTLQIEALSGEATKSWRTKQSNSLIEATQIRDSSLRRSGTKTTPGVTQESPKEEPSDVAGYERQWLQKELSEFQHQILITFAEYCQDSGRPLVVEDPEMFSRFCDDDSVTERLQKFGDSLGNRIRRTLSQLSSLGLIAKITLPKQNAETGEREYLKAFRPLRTEELTRMTDLQQLRKTLSNSEENTRYFEVELDYETSSSAGADGLFQVIALTDSNGKDTTHLIDQGVHYASLDDLRSDIADRLGVSKKLVVLEEA